MTRHPVAYHVYRVTAHAAYTYYQAPDRWPLWGMRAHLFTSYSDACTVATRLGGFVAEVGR